MNNVFVINSYDVMNWPEKSRKFLKYQVGKVGIFKQNLMKCSQ